MKFTCHPINKLCYLLLFFACVSCKSQSWKPCIQITAGFVNKEATTADKEKTVEVLRKRFAEARADVDIQLRNDAIVVKLLCNGSSDTHQFFAQQKFGIYETFQADELRPAFDAIRSQNESNASLLDAMLDQQRSRNAVIGVCAPRATQMLLDFLNRADIKKQFPDNVRFYAEKPADVNAGVSIYGIKLPEDYVPIDISMIADASAAKSYDGYHYEAYLRFNARGTKIWEKMTTKNVGRSLAILMGEEVLTCPVVNSAITGGMASIAGNFTEGETKAIAAKIKFSLPLEILIQEEKLISN